MQIEYMHVNRGENIVTFDTDTDEGRKKLADEFARMLRSGTPVMLELGGPGGETYRIQRYDPEKDKLHIAVTEEQPTPPDSEVVAGREEPEPKPDSSVPEELIGRVAKVGDRLEIPRKGRGRVRRYNVVAVSPKSGTVVAVAPVSGGSDLESPIQIWCMPHWKRFQPQFKSGELIVVAFTNWLLQLTINSEDFASFSEKYEEPDIAVGDFFRLRGPACCYLGEQVLMDIATKSTNAWLQEHHPDFEQILKADKMMKAADVARRN